ncbi:MAG: hypothetical protein VX777_04970 [Chlamydiota bacterium]|nr:hypothetical protein [Chlamydiota bacterium]
MIENQEHQKLMEEKGDYGIVGKLLVTVGPRTRSILCKTFSQETLLNTSFLPNKLLDRVSIPK